MRGMLQPPLLDLLNPFMPKFFFLTKGVLSAWFLCQMSIPSSDCDIRLVFFYFEDKMFASLFRDGGIKWVGVFSYII